MSDVDNWCAFNHHSDHCPLVVLDNSLNFVDVSLPRKVLKSLFSCFLGKLSIPILISNNDIFALFLSYIECAKVLNPFDTSAVAFVENLLFFLKFCTY